MTHLSLFTGGGGSDLAAQHLLGWRTVGYVDAKGYTCRIIRARIGDKTLHDAPIWNMDIRRFNIGPCHAYAGMVGVITAGFPCQPFSAAGQRRGADDERNMWPATCDTIRIVRPRYALLENVSNLLAHDYFGTILGELAEIGYDTEWDCIPASAVGAPHGRDRVWILAYATSGGTRAAEQPGQRGEPVESRQDLANAEGSTIGSGLRAGEQTGQRRRRLGDGRGEVADTDGGQPGARSEEGQTTARRRGVRAHSGDGCSTTRTGADTGDSCSAMGAMADPSRHESGRQDARTVGERAGPSGQPGWWECDPTDGIIEPELGRVAHGVADRVDRLATIGNGQVPAVAAAAWRHLRARVETAAIGAV